eukprot:CAMPEP_0194241816 /NCGR_PEP_ID=MMETSP0158-20130606/7556_1 /TAXON_ID=33649 /ORGANISM="Thalassionema nitzschioides, Strain L26-B" /LENGTH=165 /DNA_ID=CAMNT_0038976781 /DNA_START=523 /DNA_END=1020 /DNA_ORIENTATION=+
MQMELNSYPHAHIGIHFRAGDVYHTDILAGGGGGGAKRDQRVTDLESGLHKMLQCSRRLAKKLYPNESEESIKYYLATDNQQVKDMVNGNHKFVVTGIIPQSFIGGDGGDHDAMLEMYLLARSKGLVVNVNRNLKNADRISWFFQTAKMLGFVPHENIIECDLET